MSTPHSSSTTTSLNPVTTNTPNTLLDSTIQTWEHLTQLRRARPSHRDTRSTSQASSAQGVSHKNHIVINGQSLNIAGVVGAARYGVSPLLDGGEQVRGRIEESVQYLRKLLDAGASLYGINVSSAAFPLAFPL